MLTYRQLPGVACRTGQGEAVHILDLLFGLNGAGHGSGC